MDSLFTKRRSIENQPPESVVTVWQASLGVIQWLTSFFTVTEEDLEKASIHLDSEGRAHE